MSSRRHNWKMPKVGDDGLECLKCGRFLHFKSKAFKLTHDSIIQGRLNRDGVEGSEEFRNALESAREDQHRRRALERGAPKEWFEK